MEASSTPTRTPPAKAEEAGPHRRRWWRGAGLALAVLLLATATGADLYAAARYRASGDAGTPLSSRLAAAEAAHTVWPFARAYYTRVVTLRGLQLFGRGDILGAYDLLQAEYVREAIAKSYDPELAAAHAVVYQAYLDASSRAAHQMHAKEQPNGTIKPEDVQHFPRPPSDVASSAVATP